MGQRGRAHARAREARAPRYRPGGELRGRALRALVPAEGLDFGYPTVAEIDFAQCIGCGLCYVACQDGGYQAIAARAEHGKTRVEISKDRCVGCNLCSLVCPVGDC